MKNVQIVLFNMSLIELSIRKVKGRLLTNTTMRNGIIFSFFSFLNSGVSFLILLILANFLSPNEYGELNLFNSLLSILLVLISLSSDGLISIDFFQKDIIGLRKTINAVLLLSIGSFIVLTFILIIFSCILSIAIGISTYYQWLALLVCFLQNVAAVNLNIWRLEEKPFSYGIFSLLIVIFNLFFTLFFVASMDWGWAGRVYAQILVGGIFFIISFFLLIRGGYLKFILPTKNDFKSALHFGIPLIPHSMSFWLKQGLDKYVINFYHASAAVGVFSFSMNFSSILQIVGTAFNATNSVFIFKQLSKDKQQAIPLLRKQTKMMIIIFGLITLLLLIGCSIFLPIFFPNYSNAVYYLFPLCGASFFSCIYLLFVNFLFFYKKTKVLMIITFSISLIHCALSLFLTKYSIEYTAYISLFTSFLTALLVYLYSRKYCKLF